MRPSTFFSWRAPASHHADDTQIVANSSLPHINMPRAKIVSAQLNKALSWRSSQSFTIIPQSTPYTTMRIARPRPFYVVAGAVAVLPAVRYFSSTPRIFSASPTYSYSISAAYSDKKHPLDPSRNIYTFDPFNQVTKTVSDISSKKHKSTRPQSGQDSFFISSINSTGSLAFGVVDGVGGWETSGVDPADFAHGLCDYMSIAAAGWPGDFENSTAVAKPRELLEIGYQRVMDDDSIPGGGSTACIATVSPEGVLEAAKYVTNSMRIALNTL